MRVGTERKREPIWEGRLHLGDNPGIHGDATYAGLSIELPVTLARFPEVDAGEPADLQFELTLNRVGIVPPQLGHRAAVLAHAPTDDGWESRVVGEARITTPTATVAATGIGEATYVSVRLEIDRAVHPGLYDDVVLLALGLRSLTHYATFGFRVG